MFRPVVEDIVNRRGDFNDLLSIKGNAFGLQDAVNIVGKIDESPQGHIIIQSALVFP